MGDLSDMTGPQLLDLMRMLGRELEDLMPEGTLFALLVFDDPGRAQFIANCEWDDVIRAMRECVDHLETRRTIERASSGPRGGDRP